MPTTLVSADILKNFQAAVEPLVIVGLNIIHGVIDQPDQFGEQCEHCAAIASPTTMNIYMRSLASGEDVMISGCMPCMVQAVAADADPDHTVQLETQERPRLTNTEWQAGRDAAGTLLDIGILDVTDLRRLAEKADRVANKAHQRDDTPTWAKAHGVSTALREWLQEMGS